MRRNIISLVTSFLLVGMTPSSFGASDEECRVVMGWEPWPPLQFMDKDQKLTGLDVELMRAVFDAIDCQLDFREGHWGRNVYEVKTGTLDALSSADFTAERNKWARFSEPYRDEGMAMYMLKHNEKKFPIKSLQDIIKFNLRLGVVRDVNYGTDFAEMTRNPEFVKQLYYIEASVAQRYKVLKANRIDAFTYPTSTAREVDELSGGNVVMHPFLVSSAKQHVMFSRKSVSEETVDKFNVGLKKIRANGVYDQIMFRYENR